MDTASRLPGSVRDPQTYAIIGAAMEVHRVLGAGFLEGVYQEALGVELSLQGIQHAREIEFPVSCKGSRLERRFRADIVRNNSIIVEVKAADALGRGLLLNLGGPSLEVRRFVL